MSISHDPGGIQPHLVTLMMISSLGQFRNIPPYLEFITVGLYLCIHIYQCNNAANNVTQTHTRLLKAMANLTHIQLE